MCGQETITMSSCNKEPCRSNRAWFDAPAVYSQANGFCCVPDSKLGMVVTARRDRSVSRAPRSVADHAVWEKAG
eukprot:562624-Pyramimonas_sp.AAC.1